MKKKAYIKNKTKKGKLIEPPDVSKTIGISIRNIQIIFFRLNILEVLVEINNVNKPIPRSKIGNFI